MAKKKSDTDPQLTAAVTTQPIAREPIAIVGMGCRYPGANNVDELWDLLASERNVIRDVPKSRFDIDAFHDPRPATSGRLFARKGGFLDDASGFDTDYFRMSPREAGRMDPQHRLALEVSADALDDAFLSREELAQHVTGVYMGVWSSDWECHEYTDRKRTDVYSITGAGRCLISGRVSFAFDLRGPSLSVDTGCSASLIAAHLACQSLWLGESTLALVGGVNLVLDPWQGISFSQSGMLSADGQCKAYSKHADGLVRSDGCGVIAIMPLSAALARGSRVYAVIRGSGASNDGFSNELLTTPSEIGQELAMRAAYQCAGLTPNDVQYIEGHGTGTRAGDPVELRALAKVMSERPSTSPCFVGSIKSNIGHTEGAAGVAGVIKTALAIHHRVIPKSLFSEEPTPLHDWKTSKLKLASRTEPWPSGTARGAVSSFGISGTDVHVILEESPPTAAKPSQPQERDELVLLSAMRESSLQTSAAALRELVAEPERSSLHQISYSAAVGRTHLRHRLAIVARTRAVVDEALQAYVNGEEHPGLSVGTTRENLSGPVFVFAGHGPQWPGMGRELYASEPVFRRALEQCDAALRRHVDWSVLDELERTDAEGWQIAVIQPCIFAVQVALCALWRSWNVVPAAVIGHSMGEVAAAHVAGVLSLDDAAHIICRRAQNLQDLTGKGGMLAVELPLPEAEALAGHYRDLVSVAASNSPGASVLSGDLQALAEIAKQLRGRDVFCRELKVDAPAHSPLLDPLLPAFERDIAGVRPLAEAAVPIFSTVTGGELQPGAFTAAYWTHNQRQPVRFAEATRSLVQRGHSLFLEIGPHPILRGPLQQVLAAEQQQGVVLGSLKRDEPERAHLLRSLGQLHILGLPVSLRALFDAPQPFVALPRYAWQRDPFDALPTGEQSAQLGQGVEPAQDAAELGAFGEPVSSALHARTQLWQLPLAPASSSYLADHVVQAAAVLPGAAYLSFALAAATRAFGSDRVGLDELEFATALVLPADTVTHLQVSLTIEQPGRAQIRFYTSTKAVDDAPARWTLHAQTRARRLDTAHTPTEPLDIEAIKQRCEPLAPEEHYRVAEAHGFHYGAAFRGIEQLWTSEREALVKVSLPEHVGYRRGGFPVHPALLDACWQALAGKAWTSTPAHVLHLPVKVERVTRLREPGTVVWAHAQLHTAPDADEVIADVRVFDEHGELAIESLGFTVHRVEGQAPSLQDALYELSWQPSQPLPAAQAASFTGQSWLVLADRRAGVGQQLATLLTRSGAACKLAFADAVSGGSESVDPRDPAAVQALLARAVAAAGRPLDGIVDLWALDAVASESATNATLDEAQALGVIGATHLLQALTAQGASGTKLFFVSAGAQQLRAAERVQFAQAPLWALGRVLRYECPDLSIHNVDLGPLSGSMAERETELSALLRELAHAQPEAQVALRGAERSVLQLVHAPVRVHDAPTPAAAAQPLPHSANYQLTTRASGVLDNLFLQEAPRTPLQAGEVEIEVAHAALNFIDVMKALGIYPGMGTGPVELGRECSGSISALGAGVVGLQVGQRVVTMVSGETGAFARYVRTPAALVAPCPERIESAQAAAIPCVFLTAYYAMLHLGRLSRGERVLIHSAAGGVGLAAIALAQRAGAEIYATAGNDDKRAYLKRLGVQHVFDSRSTAFAAEIMAATGGEGVDMVLNSLAGEAIPLSLGLLRDDGRFLEIGKRDIYDDMPLGLLPFKRGLSFSHIDLARLVRDKPEQMGEMLRELMDMFARAELPTLPLTLFAMDGAVEAFHYMAQGNHIGKIVLTALDPQHIPARVEPAAQAHAAAPLAAADASYLITGGLGGLGLLAADWLVKQGARELVLTGRSAASAAASGAIAALEAQGARVHVAACDVGSHVEVERLLRYIQAELPPLRGVIHAAGVLADGLAQHLTAAQFAQALWPKLHGAFNLHQHTAALPLDFFVLFSSAAALLGSPGQGNYAAGNEFMDALAEYRRACGLPALSIDWGPWSQSGMAASPDRAGRLLVRGMGQITDALGVQLLDHLMRSDHVRAGALPYADFASWCSYYPATATTLLTSLLAQKAQSTRGTGGGEAGPRAAILQAPAAERPALVEARVMDLLRRVLRIPGSKPLDPDLPLNRFGLDSLMAIELKNRIDTELGVSVQVSKILLCESLRKFSAELLDAMGSEQQAAPLRAALAVGVAGGGGIERVLEQLDAGDQADELLSDDFFAVQAGE